MSELLWKLAYNLAKAGGSKHKVSRPSKQQLANVAVNGFQAHFISNFSVVFSIASNLQIF